MINPKHPLQYYNTQQEFFLKHLAENNIEYHTLHISYSNAVYLYYDLQLNISESHYEEWLNGIQDEQVKSAMHSEGFEKCTGNELFVQFLNDKRAVTENDYIRQKMGHEEYSRYQVLCQGN